MRAIRTETTIDAPPDVVWRELVDLAAYSTWNPFIIQADGIVAVGERLVLRMKPPGGRPMTFKPTVLKAEAGRELRWLGRLGFKGIFDGEHYFQLEGLPGERTKLIQGENFSGITVGLFGAMLKKTERGFVELNDALRERCERAG